MKKQDSLSNAELAAFCRQTALIYKAGLTPAAGMGILIHDTLSEEGKNLLTEIGLQCQKGEKLHTALQTTGVFPDYVINLIALGEESGETETVLTSLAEYYEREDEVSEGIRTAITYPLIMIAMMFLIIIVLVVKVLPIFKQVFVQLGSDMSPFAEKMMGMGNVLSRYAVVFTVILVLLMITFIILFKVPKFKEKATDILSRMPVARDFYNNVAISRFASAMYLGISTGMDIFKNLDMAESIVENKAMEEKVRILRTELESRATLSEGLAKADIFSNLYTKMIDIGEQAGSRDQIMKQIAEHYDEATAKQLRRILSVIEPSLVIILSLIVGIILLSVLLPLMGIMSSIG